MMLAARRHDIMVATQRALTFRLIVECSKRNWTARFVSFAVRFKWSAETAEFRVRQWKLLTWC
jgi:hypothetical protein